MCVFTTESRYQSVAAARPDIDGEAASDASGNMPHLSLSADGSTVAIGARNNHGANGAGSGHVRIYKWNSISNQWEKAGKILMEKRQMITVEHPYRCQPIVQLSPSEPIAIKEQMVFDLGMCEFMSDPGNTQWVKRGQDIDGEAAEDNSGEAISISADGSILDRAQTNNPDSKQSAGHVRVYKYNNGNNHWSLLGDIT